MLPHPLNNFQIENNYQNRPKFNSAYSRNNLPEIKDVAYRKGLDEFKSIGTHQIALYVNGSNVISFNSFGVEHIQKKIKNSQGTTI